MKYEPEHIEWEAARKVSLFAKRECGLDPKDAFAEMRPPVLRVWLLNALSPAGHLIAQSEQGVGIVQEVCGMIHEKCAERLNGLVARIAGCPVKRSFVEVDPKTEDVCMTFVLEPPVIQSGSAKAA
jgi:uncharacterized protein YbcI